MFRRCVYGKDHLDIHFGRKQRKLRLLHPIT